MTPDPYAAEYRGPAVLAAAEARVDVTVALSGHMEPIDGKYHWYGRITAGDAADTVADLRQRRVPVTLAVPGGDSVTAQLTERDPWGDVRITGTGQPPYPLEPLEELEST